jgi:hypothetical protein
MCKDSKSQEKDSGKLSRQYSNEALSRNGVTIDNNPYIPNIGPTYTLHNIWRKTLSK